MTVVFRIVLILVSLLTLIGIIRKIRNSKMQIESTIFWIVFSLLLLILSIFPQLADCAASVLGIQSTVNFIFIFVIFIMMIHQFYSDVKLSQIEAKLHELIEELAIKD